MSLDVPIYVSVCPIDCLSFTPPLTFTADKFDAGMHPMPALTQQNHSTEFPSQSLKKRGDKRENLIQLTIWRKSRFAIRILQHALKLDVHSALQQSALLKLSFHLAENNIHSAIRQCLSPLRQQDTSRCPQNYNQGC